MDGIDKSDAFSTETKKKAFDYLACLNAWNGATIHVIAWPTSLMFENGIRSDTFEYSANQV